jgi:hypothetical protein
MPKADNRLGSAKVLGALGGASLGQQDKFKPNDIETLYRFDLNQSSSFNLSLSGLVKKSNADVELYRLKRPASEAIGLMGNLDFRLVSGSVLNENLALVAASRRKKNRNESLALGSLDAGEYVVRVVGRSGKSRYQLQMGAVALAPGKPEEQTKKDTIAPSAILRAANFETEGSSTYDFTVTYNDDVAISVGSLDGNDVLVMGPNGFSQLARKVSHSGDGVASTATYQITAPVGTWSLAENGNYSVSLQGNQVSDSNGNYAPAASLGSFLMNTPLRGLKHSGTSNGPMGTDYVFDIDTSTGLLKKFEITILIGYGRPFANSPYVFGPTKLEVFKASPGGISSQEYDNLRARMPTTFFGRTSASGRPAELFSSEIIFFARLGDKSDAFGNPTEAFVLGVKTNNPDLSDPLALLKIALDGETAGTQINGGFYSEASTAQGFRYTTIPSARLNRMGTANLLSNGVSTYNFTVTYSDNAAIDTSTIDDNDIKVTDLNGYSQLAKKVSVSNSGNGSPVTVTYQVTGVVPNAEGFLDYDYQVALQANQIKDVNGNPVPSGFFNVTFNNEGGIL